MRGVIYQCRDYLLRLGVVLLIQGVVQQLPGGELDAVRHVRRCLGPTGVADTFAGARRSVQARLDGLGALQGVGPQLPPVLPQASCC